MDDLRLAVIIGVVVVHAIGTYGVDVGWYDQGPPASAGVLAVLVGPAWIGLLFGLAPLFALAGWAAARSIDDHGATRFLGRRLIRLGVPLAVYVLAIDPFTAYLAGGADRGSWDALWARIRSWRGHDLGPTWFLFALLAFSLLFAVAAAVVPGLARRRDRPDRVRIMLLSGAALAGAIAVLDVAVWWRWSYTASSPWGLDPAHWPQSAGVFALGVLAYRGRWFEPVSREIGRAGSLGVLTGLGGLAALAAVVLSTRTDYLDLAGGGHWPSVGFAVADGLIAVGISLWMAAFFQHRRHSPSTGRARPLARGSYAAYLLHPPLLVAIAIALQATGWSADLQLLALIMVAPPAALILGAGATRLPAVNRVL